MISDKNSTNSKNVNSAPNNEASFLKNAANNPSKTKTNAVEIPSISLPKGGGAIKGIDEKFTVNVTNGTAAFSIAVPFSPARGAMPDMSLSYNSGAGNSIFGLGWNLNSPSIKRKTDKGLPQYMDLTDSDTFLFSEAEDLVPEFKKDNNGKFLLDGDDYVVNEKPTPDKLFTIRFYKPRIEGLFARIERWRNDISGEIKWRVITKENVTTLYGWSPGSRISSYLDPDRIYEWLPEFTFDDKGNCTQYIYKKEDEKGFDPLLLHHRNRLINGKITYSNLYLSRICYGNINPYTEFGKPYPAESEYLISTVFDYGEYSTNQPYNDEKEWAFRKDAFSDYKAGFEIRTTRLCRRIMLFHSFKNANEYEGLVKSLDFGYDTTAQQDFTFLKSITTVGYIKKDNGTYTYKNLPPIEFEYQKHEWNKDVKSISIDNLMHAPTGLDEQQNQFTDLFNEGLSGILTEQANGWYYKQNLGNGNFDNARLISPKPSFVGLGNQLQLADLDADGGKQLVNYETDPKGYFELNDGNEWQKFQNFKSLPNLDFGDVNTRMVDLNGDGKAEVLISEDNKFTWYPSEGRNGFSRPKQTIKPSDEEAGPHMIFADNTQGIFLSDMSGDGLPDIIRIRNGEVCYWPNLGYGKFGAKVNMDNAPRFDMADAFNPSYLKLADIDGSGTTDIIYLGKNKFTCWINFSGNSFTQEPFEIDAFPEIHNYANIAVTDLLGNGIACIVWNSSLIKDVVNPLKYIDLMNSRKPHIMVGYRNNMGKEVSLEYMPSTHFYLEDKKAGTPWVSKLHFPVHCIAKTETKDLISGYVFMSEYKYHHGYYDHAEREFRGFGLVEQTDTEDFENWKMKDATNVTEEILHQPPVFTKTWTHTGAFRGKDNILTQYEHEYWYEEIKRKQFDLQIDEYHLPDALITDENERDLIASGELSLHDWQEALRSCKGMVLRSEVFSKSNDLRMELTPYTVSDHNCIIQRLQPKGRNRHAIFIVKESEAVTYTYEQSLFQSTPGSSWISDPRIAHNLNIKFDNIGNVLEAASVVYPRITVNTTPPQVRIEAQDETYITYIQNTFTKKDIDEYDAYRLRLPAEVKTFQLKGITKTGNFYTIDDFQDILSDTKSVTLEYHQLDEPLSNNRAQRRLIEHIRTLYRNNNLIDSLPWGEMHSLGISYESYQLAYTKELLHEIYSSKKTDTELVDLMLEGKFISTDGDSKWWVPSGTTNFIEISNPDANNLAKAKARFYLPVSFTDPYGSKTRVKYYSNYSLLIEVTEDASGNQSRVDLFNFRTLSPQRLRDLNDNLSEVILDELGLVKAMSIMGKDINNIGLGDEADDLSGLNDFTEDAENVLINEFFNVPNTMGICNSVILAQKAQQLLKHATVRFVYNFDIYNGDVNKIIQNPIVVASIVREEHFQKNNNAPLQLSFEYSNGMGQVIMKKVQAEPGVAKQVTVDDNNRIYITTPDPDTSPFLRWIGNGRTILNNKGQVVKQYEPFFSISPNFEKEKELVEAGVTPIMYYDAVGRLIKTEMPDGTFSKVEFDSWQERVFDANDNVKESAWYAMRLLLPVNSPERKAAEKTQLHHNTPSQLHFDTLGRPVLQIENNGKDSADNDILFKTKITLDIEGNLRKVVDAREISENNMLGNVVMRYKYDMLGNQVYQNSMDAGERWMMINILGQPLKTWDALGHEYEFKYNDSLHRPSEKIVKGITGAINTSFTIEKIIYGESLPDAKIRNLRGQIYQHYDSAGRAQTDRIDFKGNVLEERKMLTNQYNANAIDWSVNPLTKLENEEFVKLTEYDALNRVISMRNWQSQLTIAGIYTPEYNERGLLKGESISIDNEITETIRLITYNEKGQRLSQQLGCFTTTRYRYDQENFRLISLLTSPPGGGNSFLQNLVYTYDPVGNITEIEDKAFDPVFFNNQMVEAKSTYTYDALYHLSEATGRENSVLDQIPQKLENSWTSVGFPISNPDALRNYTQKYGYDQVGNITEMRHMAGNGTQTQRWSRTYNYQTDNNRLKYTFSGNDLTTQVNYMHDLHGNIKNLGPINDELIWNYNDMIQTANLGGGGIVTYNYSGDKQRSRKRIIKQGITEDRIYLEGFEVYRRWQGTALLENIESHHLFADSERVLIAENIRTTDNNNLPVDVLYRYQYSNLLGSVGLELNKDAEIISYEEYHPYGTTAYKVKNAAIYTIAKRYRYTGMERDEETGMSYHGSRYYLPWLARWSSVDSKYLEDGPNTYLYCHSSPIQKSDKMGFAADESTPGTVANSLGKRTHESLNKLMNAQGLDTTNPTFTENGDEVTPARPEGGVEIDIRKTAGGPDVDSKASGKTTISGRYLDKKAREIAIQQFKHMVVTKKSQVALVISYNKSDEAIDKMRGKLQKDVARRVRFEMNKLKNSNPALAAKLIDKKVGIGVTSIQKINKMTDVALEKNPQGLKKESGKLSPQSRNSGQGNASIIGTMAQVALPEVAGKIVPAGVTEVTSMLIQGAADWVESVGPQNALTGLIAATTYLSPKLGLLTASAGTSVGAAFGATSLGAIATAGAGAVAVAGGAVAISAVAGYAIGKGINERLTASGATAAVDRFLERNGVYDLSYNLFFK